MCCFCSWEQNCLMLYNVSESVIRNLHQQQEYWAVTANTFTKYNSYLHWSLVAWLCFKFCSSLDRENHQNSLLLQTNVSEWMIGTKAATFTVTLLLWVFRTVSRCTLRTHWVLVWLQWHHESVFMTVGSSMLTQGPKIKNSHVGLMLRL